MKGKKIGKTIEDAVFDKELGISKITTERRLIYDAEEIKNILTNCKNDGSFILFSEKDDKVAWISYGEGFPYQISIKFKDYLKKGKPGKINLRLIREYNFINETEPSK